MTEHTLEWLQRELELAQRMLNIAHERYGRMEAECQRASREYMSAGRNVEDIHRRIAKLKGE